MRSSLSLLVCAFVVFGCSGKDKSNDGAGGAAGSTGSGGSAGVLQGDQYSVDIGPIDVGPGVEKTQCVLKRLPNAASIHVGRVDNAISNGSHHLIVYRTNDTTEQPDPFSCQPFRDTLDPTKGSPVMITQKHSDYIQLPTGVGYTFDAGQMIRLELHYINPSGSTIKVNAKSTFTVLPDEAFQQEASFLFIGTPDISLQPQSAATVGPVFFPIPSEYAGVNFFAITGHTHSHGTNVTVNTATDASDTGTPVYDVPGWQWSEPATVVHDPPFQVAQGGGFRFQCDYQNDSTQYVGFGESATDEMCFFWAYYYPSTGTKVCFHTTKAGGMNFCCPGAFQCSLLGF